MKEKKPASLPEDTKKLIVVYKHLQETLIQKFSDTYKEKNIEKMILYETLASDLVVSYENLSVQFKALRIAAQQEALLNEMIEEENNSVKDNFEEEKHVSKNLEYMSEDLKDFLKKHPLNKKGFSC